MTERPALAIFEDLHWADSALLDLLEDVLEHLDGPLLVLCLARTELSAAAPGWGRGPGDPLDIVLEPLLATDAAGLVTRLVPERWLPDQVLDRIVARGEGNPFFLEEIVRGLVDRATVGRAEGAPIAADLAALPIPDTVQAVLAARIDLLDATDKRAIQAASVAGTSLWPGLLARLVDVDAARIPGILARLEARALIVPRAESSIEGEREYAFKHALTQQVAYDSLPRRERMQAHARTAAWLEETLGERRRAFAEPLARHYESAYRAAAEDPGIEAAVREGLRTRAVAALLQASADSLGTLALDASERLARRALDVARGDLERSRALEAIGETALAGFRGDSAWKALCAAADARAAAAPDDHAAISRICARALDLPTRWGSLQVLPTVAEARHYLDLGLEHAGPGDGEARARLLTSSAVMPLAFFEAAAPEREFEAARARGQEAVEIARRLDRPDLESAALDGLGSHAYSRGEYEQLAVINAGRLALVGRLADVREIEDVYAMAAWGAFNQGRFADALTLADEGFRRAVEVSPAVAVHCLEWRSLANFELGNWDAFLADVARATTMLPGREDEARPGFRRRPWMVAALLYRLRGDARGTQDALERALPLTIPRDDQVAEDPDPGQPWQALLLARQGLFGEARAATVLPVAPYHRQAAGLLIAARCEVVAMAGAWDEVPALLAEAESEARRGGLLALPAHAQRLEGRAARAGSDLHGAIDALSRARAGFHRIGARWERACTELDLAEALAAARRAEQARTTLAGAWSIFEELHSVDELARATELRARLSGGSGLSRSLSGRPGNGQQQFHRPDPVDGLHLQDRVAQLRQGRRHDLHQQVDGTGHDVGPGHAGHLLDLGQDPQGLSAPGTDADVGGQVRRHVVDALDRVRHGEDPDERLGRDGTLRAEIVEDKVLDVPERVPLEHEHGVVAPHHACPESNTHAFGRWQVEQVGQLARAGASHQHIGVDLVVRHGALRLAHRPPRGRWRSLLIMIVRRWGLPASGAGILGCEPALVCAGAPRRPSGSSGHGRTASRSRAGAPRRPSGSSGHGRGGRGRSPIRATASSASERPRVPVTAPECGRPLEIDNMSRRVNTRARIE